MCDVLFYALVRHFVNNDVYCPILSVRCLLPDSVSSDYSRFIWPIHDFMRETGYHFTCFCLCSLKHYLDSCMYCTDRMCRQHCLSCSLSNCSVRLLLQNRPNGGVSRDFTVDFSPTVRWGINFAAIVKVKRSGSQSTGIIYIPGTRTYDPTGRSGDTHASERIGASCANAQTLLTAASLVVAQHGGNSVAIDRLHAACQHLIERYHGRMALMEYMRQQVIAVAVDASCDEVSFAEFVASRIGQYKGDVRHEHTRKYHMSYVAGPTAQPPVEFFEKIAAKEDVQQSMSAAQHRAFVDLLSRKSLTDSREVDRGHGDCFVSSIVVVGIVLTTGVIAFFTLT
eukprot:m.623601 g.623601  ORF g.623601 m.623601 type:complete len:339 (-) comp22545_c0_seq28:1035-2051(-)